MALFTLGWRPTCFDGICMLGCHTPKMRKKMRSTSSRGLEPIIGGLLGGCSTNWTTPAKKKKEIILLAPNGDRTADLLLEAGANEQRCYSLGH